MKKLSILGALALSMQLFAAEPAKVVTEKIDLIQAVQKKEVGFFLNEKADVADKAEDIFKIVDGQLLVTGRGYGYMYTNQSYKDYHLIIEFKWTGPTIGKRADKARDNGILVHCHGPHGILGGTWISSIEAQIIEGGMGDILVLGAKDAEGKEYVTSVEAEFELDRDGEKRWKKGAPRQLVKSGRINWEKRDEDWADKVDYRGKDDLDAPMGQWNRLEVIARGDTLQYLFNGKLVNEAFKCQPSEGPIALQTEAAEMLVRRYELLPLQ